MKNILMPWKSALFLIFLLLAVVPIDAQVNRALKMIEQGAYESAVPLLRSALLDKQDRAPAAGRVRRTEDLTNSGWRTPRPGRKAY